MDYFDKQTLKSHNSYRALHQVPPLTWNSGLARDAQAWAEQLAMRGRLKHADTQDGENIYVQFGQADINGEEAVDKWYNEVNNYDFGKPGFQSNTGHFTQVVWRDTEEFGVGKAQGEDGKIFVVGRYRPAGNNMRHFKENVLPMKNGPLNHSNNWDAMPNNNQALNQEPHHAVYLQQSRPKPIRATLSEAREPTPVHKRQFGEKDTKSEYKGKWESNRRSREFDKEDFKGNSRDINRLWENRSEPKGKARESIKKWEQASTESTPVSDFKRKEQEINDLVLRNSRGLRKQDTIEDRIKKFEPEEYRPKPRPPRPVSEPNISYKHAETAQSRPTPAWKTERDNKPRPSSIAGSCGKTRSTSDPKQIVTTFTDGPRRTVVSAITVTLKGNGHSHKKELWSYKKPIIDEEIKPTIAKPRPLVIDMEDDSFNGVKGRGGQQDNSRYDSIDKKKNKPSSSRATLELFQQQALDAHNYFRAFHGVKNLKWSHDLARGAQAWAEKLARERTLKHSTRERGEDGENLAMFTGKYESAGEEATNMWYEESAYYNFNRPGYQSNTGHFTQVVWKGTKELGLGRAKTPDGRLTFVVGRYRPSGNMLREFDNNVFPQQY
ncbi:uncharacterized protein LOC5521460 isoform X2 [Nematostella vectensis]|uniref:uncharacterized protein LOC5521460 isoform X2 n=1 Tax=Nematostella vectensis TaxID=45351 RepID=UPI0020771FE7|nr:uncharacterized protein LOC5521460 isoform X2 [Nematostella vectensis]